MVCFREKVTVLHGGRVLEGDWEDNKKDKLRNGTDSSWVTANILIVLVQSLPECMTISFSQSDNRLI